MPPTEKVACKANPPPALRSVSHIINRVALRRPGDFSTEPYLNRPTLAPIGAEDTYIRIGSEKRAPQAAACAVRPTMLTAAC